MSGMIITLNGADNVVYSADIDFDSERKYYDNDSKIFYFLQSLRNEFNINISNTGTSSTYSGLNLYLREKITTSNNTTNTTSTLIKKFYFEDNEQTDDIEYLFNKDAKYSIFGIEFSIDSDGEEVENSNSGNEIGPFDIQFIFFDYGITREGNTLKLEGVSSSGSYAQSNIKWRKKIDPNTILGEDVEIDIDNTDSPINIYTVTFNATITVNGTNIFSNVPLSLEINAGSSDNINLHLAAYKSGGIAIGRMSTSENNFPKFECMYPMYYRGYKFGYFSGDTLILNEAFRLPAYITSGSDLLKGTIFLGQPIFASKITTDTTGKFGVRTIDGYVYGNSDNLLSLDNKDYNQISLRIADAKGGVIAFSIRHLTRDGFRQKGDLNKKITNNTPVIVYFSDTEPVTLTFKE